MQMTELSEELRIIATETGRLSAVDRATIARAANDLEAAINRSISLDRQLLEANAHKVALTDQLADERRKAAGAVPAPLPWSMRTGWIRVDVLP
jgi:hypothetical protein